MIVQPSRAPQCLQWTRRVSSAISVATWGRKASTMALGTVKSRLPPLKTPKGTRDYDDKDMAIRRHVLSTISRVFEKHGAITIDTPVFELRDLLANKYGEDSKLIYDLADQGGEACSLRYDLTVPFARFLAMHRKEYPTMKRYHIAKVYRRDQPTMSKGRLREFYQCDFDIAGKFDPMIPDASALYVLSDALDALDISNVTIRINHRQILQGIFELSGVQPGQIRAISSAVDKLDKLPWESVREEMVAKGLSVESADRIGGYIHQKGDDTLLQTLKHDPILMSNACAAQGVADLELLFEYLEAYGIRNRMAVDMSLARGLDYYTGVIYEAVVEGADLGSIAAGGRYDNLVGSLIDEGSTKSQIPCVGVSIGVERLFAIMASRQSPQQTKSCATEVFVVSVGDGLLKERIELVRELCEAGIKASFLYKRKPKLQKQWTACEKDRIPFAVIVGKDELDQGMVRIKAMDQKDPSQGNGQLTDRKDMITELQECIHQWRLTTSPPCKS